MNSNLTDSSNEGMAPLLVNYDTAARMLGMGRRTLETLVANQRLPSVRIGRRRLFRPSDLAAWAEGTTTASGRSSESDPQAPRSV